MEVSPDGTAAPPTATAALFEAIPTFARFDRIGDDALFRPLPDDWMVGLADVVGSTDAIAAGRYKDVNTAGASVISAIANALGTLDFPFVFAGDGAGVAVARSEAAAASVALAATSRWVSREMGLQLRVGTVTVGEARAAGHDVRVARFAASDDARFAMFAGGGMGWAEARLKAGALRRPEAPADAHPDFAGLSCRFQDLRSRQGLILSLLVLPTTGEARGGFDATVATVLQIVGEAREEARPVPVFHPLRAFSPTRIAANARLARRPGQSKGASLLAATWQSLLAAVLLPTGATLGRFSARRYLAEVVANTDFRKYDDGLMMTLDCSAACAAEIERVLADAEGRGVARYGLHRQGAATVTCLVPSATSPNHVHFVDGSAGGYALAAHRLKSSASMRPAPMTSLRQDQSGMAT